LPRLYLTASEEDGHKKIRTDKSEASSARLFQLRNQGQHVDTTNPQPCQLPSAEDFATRYRLSRHPRGNLGIALDYVLFRPVSLSVNGPLVPPDSYGHKAAGPPVACPNRTIAPLSRHGPPPSRQALLLCFGRLSRLEPPVEESPRSNRQQPVNARRASALGPSKPSPLGYPQVRCSHRVAQSRSEPPLPVSAC